MFDIFCMQVTDNTVDLPAHTRYTRWNGTHLDTIRRCVNRARTEYVWIVADCCDYSDFDFTWQPVPWEADQIHCWASGNQQFGDTFLVPVKAFKKQEAELKLLEWYEHINWHNDPYIPRYKWPTVQSLDEQTSLYAWHKHVDADIDYEPSLWKKRNLHAFGKNGSVLLVPRDCKQHFLTQYYDYPYILRHTEQDVREKPQDIVFVSYDEINADLNYEILKKRFPRAKRVHGVEGMVPALKEACKISDTDHVFVVFAKTQLHEDFDFSFLPDRLKEPSHYLFHGLNMSNGLQYGTLGVTMYNCKLVLDATTWGVDFTTSFPVQVVPVISAYGYFAEDEYRAWRTAFRECVKLQSKCIDNQVDIETEYRLKVWTSHAEGPYSEWVLKGAQDGVEYADSGDDLMNVLDWHWLRRYYDAKYSSKQLTT